MSTSPIPGRRSAGDRKTPPSSSIVTRNGARKAKIQTRAMSAGAKPSAAVIAAKKKAQMKRRQQGDVVLRDYYQIAMEAKNKVKLPTGFVTEPRMAEHRCLWDDKYPENPQRLISVIDRCKELDLIEQCQQFPPRAATKEELTVLHSPAVYDLLETTHQNQDVDYLEEVSSRYDAIYIHPSTHELALIAAGSTIDMVSRVVSGELQNGFAAVRPPGHHAMRAEPCGYCFYNNVALAARHALDNLGLNRILIVDWDVHHGQATQQMFYEDPRVVYFSIHRYEHGAFWPSLRQSDCQYVGAGAGAGSTFNVPLNRTGMTDADYLAIWHQLLIPMALEYQPELIVVSAGYDAAVGCPEGEMLLSPACYATLVHQLMCVCSRVCVVLEGGYCARSLAEGAALTLRTLLGHAPPALVNLGVPSDDIRESILNCIYTHKKFWRCFKFQPTYSVDTSVPNVCDAEKDKHTVVLKWEGDERVPDRYQTRDCYPLQSEKTISDLMAILDQMIADTDLSIPKHAVGYCYDERMLKHKNICEPAHPECPERVLRAHEQLTRQGLVARAHPVPARAAADPEILAVHRPDHLDRLKKLAGTKLRDLNSQKCGYDSVYFHPDSLESAAVAAGCVLQMVDAVLSGEVGAGVCAVRPPGHHADGRAPSGFCLLNSVAMAARRALGGGAARVLVLDWDVHHGNGTQRITYESDQILYISIHRYDHGTFFPSSKEADYTEVGAGAGAGYNINIPWNKRGFGDAEYLAAMTQVVLPVAYEFRPDLVLVSAGFDAAAGDPLGGCKVTPECFARMTMMLRGLASGRVVLCLEGGYNITSVAHALTMCTKALLGDPIPFYYNPETICHPSAVESITNVIKVHRKYWKSLKFYLALPIEDVIENPGPSRGLVISETGSGQSLDECMAQLSIGKSMSRDGSQEEVKNHAESTCGSAPGESENGSTPEENASGSVPSQGANGSAPRESASGFTPRESAGGSNSGESAYGGNPLDRPGPSGGREAQNPAKILASVLGAASAVSGVDQVTQDLFILGMHQEIAPEDDDLMLKQSVCSLGKGGPYAVVPEPWCPHVDGLPDLPEGISFEQGLKCMGCDERLENWVCLHCYAVYCSRYANRHLQQHFSATEHPLSLSLADLSAWCSACGMYLDHPRLHRATNNAHRCKFGEDMPRRSDHE